jgi:hypothetical protein
MSAVTFSEYLRQERSRDPIVRDFAKEARLHNSFHDPKLGMSCVATAMSRALPTRSYLLHEKYGGSI